MKRALIGDTHLGVRGGDIDFLNFQLDWIEGVFKDCSKQGIKKVVQVGDMFDNRRTLDVRVGWLVTQRLLKSLDDNDLQLDIIVGNHNIFFRESNEIHNLWFLEHHPRIRVIVENLEEDNILYLGWINKNNLESQMNAVNETKAKYCFSHLELADFPMYKGIPAIHGQDAALFKKFDRVMTGHYHTVSEIGNVAYLGSPYHLTWGDYPDGTNRGWFIFDDQTGSLEIQKNTVDQSLFSVWYYDPEVKYELKNLQHLAGKIVRIVVKDKGDTRRYNSFLALLREISFIEYKIIDETIIEKKEQEGFSPEIALTNVATVISNYIEKLAETVPGADIQLTKSIAIDLYTKASE